MRKRAWPLRQRSVQLRELPLGYPQRYGTAGLEKPAPPPLEENRRRASNFAFNTSVVNRVVRRAGFFLTNLIGDRTR